MYLLIWLTIVPTEGQCSGKYFCLQLKHLATSSNTTPSPSYSLDFDKKHKYQTILPFLSSSIFSLEISSNIFPPFDCACSLLQRNSENSTHHGQRLSNTGTMGPSHAEYINTPSLSRCQAKDTSRHVRPSKTQIRLHWRIQRGDRGFRCGPMMAHL